MKVVHLWVAGLVLLGITTSASAFVLNQRLGLTAEEVKNVQRCLLAMGYQIGRTDGAWGARTQLAVVQWFLKSGLPAHATDTMIGQRFAQDCTVAVAPNHPRPQRPAHPTFQYGLTKGEVRQILGEPYAMTGTEPNVLWWYFVSANEVYTLQFQHGIFVDLATTTLKMDHIRQQSESSSQPEWNTKVPLSDPYKR